MAKKRKEVPASTVRAAHHEAGFRCANPTCRFVLVIDVHHIFHVEEGGGNELANLLVLCKNCHGLYHAKVIPRESIRVWKMLLVALNEAVDRNSVDLLLMVDKAKEIWTSGDGFIHFAPLVASGLVEFSSMQATPWQLIEVRYRIALSERGRVFLEGWKSGDQAKAMAAASISSPGTP